MLQKDEKSLQSYIQLAMQLGQGQQNLTENRSPASGLAFSGLGRLGPQNQHLIWILVKLGLSQSRFGPAQVVYIFELWSELEAQSGSSGVLVNP